MTSALQQFGYTDICFVADKITQPSLPYFTEKNIKPILIVSRSVYKTLKFRKSKVFNKCLVAISQSLIPANAKTRMILTCAGNLQLAHDCKLIIKPFNKIR